MNLFERTPRRAKAIEGPIPAVQARAGEFVVSDLPAGMDGYSELPSQEAPGTFSVPNAQDPESLAIRALHYGYMAIYSDYRVPRDLTEQAYKAQIQPHWEQAGRFIMAASHMAARHVKEIHQLPAPNIKGLKIDRSIAASLYMKAQLFSAISGWSEVSAAAAKHLKSDERLLLQHAAARIGKFVESTTSFNPATYLKVLRLLQDFFPIAEPGYGPDGDREPQEPPPSSPVGIKMANRMFVDYEMHHNDQWAPMTHYKLPLDIQHRAAKRLAHIRRPGFFGAFRYPHRALLPSGDGQAFSYRRYVPGGTLLLDHSGSMHLTNDQVEALLTACPTIEMAAYSSRDSGGTIGSIVTAIKDGRSVDAATLLAHFNNGTCCNSCDGPALRWLAKMPRPRIWISDGMVNGLNGDSSMMLVQECAQIVRDNDILRFENIDEFLRAYSKQGARS